MTASLSRMVRLNAVRFAETEALVHDERVWTYRELDRDVDALAAGLRADGVGRGDRVAIVADNVPEFFVLALALSRLGAVFVPLNYRLTDAELAHLIGHAGVGAVASVPEFAPLVERALARLGPAGGGPRRYGLEPVGPGWRPVGEVIAARRGERVDDVPLEADALQRIVYTSGTTSLPKGVLLTHGNVQANIHAQVVELALRPGDRVLDFAPLYHVGGTDLPGFAVWQAGGTIVLHRRVDPAAILRDIEAHRITGMVLAATMLDMVRREAERTGADLSSVRWLIFSQVTSALFAVARGLFPAARLIEGYGLTETCSALTYLDEAHMESRQGSVGLPVPWVEVRVVDDLGRDVAPGEPGEVVARGPKVSPGYLDDEAATARAFRDGWFHTGDVGVLDDDGYLTIRDRLKDMIRSGGENMASAEIENVLADHPDVLAVAVVGAPDPRWQEVPVAFVVARPGLDPAALVDGAGDRLSRFKLPKAVYLVDELPTNPSGKVLKRTLRERAGELTPSWERPPSRPG